ncbi:MAG: guanylate kinase [Candidatus Moranbacteria bacterium RIFOXYB1_FULL_43_19]|nr:MAG: guanylate kinase [Candidatus Moranbacteria bacterium RIFOXYB1_FULL_43_19]OGI28920.1 MAG: guanylate kinase [Candidatus Moranbacteria bacterium RIFOXYA1_FULL_44_7]OGI33506.1 MAG: guanylate kinase [Candidatus Moranbacteria bacterium RIFOXYC1_FULL_44_13]OGI38381.1 MAG: guanylate kinase [Candidatus Moranbacteria bacterium RIFOXYD1_FULL_44_12]
MVSKIFIITGTSGAGKDSVIEKIKDKNLEFEWVKTTVSRPMREGESQGNPYYFVTPEEFQNKINRGEMIEHALVYGKYYGGEKEEIERCLATKKPVIWKVDIQGVPTIKKHYPDAVCIFISAPSFEALEKRIRGRAKDDEETIRKRMKAAKEEMKDANINPLYDHVVVNEEDRLAETAGKVTKIIQESFKEPRNTGCA